MEAITASLEKSMQNCSLSGGGGRGDAKKAGGHGTGGDMTVELNSDVSLPFHWEQCLDLKTGEVYYINWRTGMRAKEDPRQATSYEQVDCYDSEELESTVESEDDDDDDEEESSSTSRDEINGGYRSEQEVLVVAGCKSCLMYFMLPKTTVQCPKCTGFLLHFDRQENGVL